MKELKKKKIIVKNIFFRKSNNERDYIENNQCKVKSLLEEKYCIKNVVIKKLEKLADKELKNAFVETYTLQKYL